MAKSLSVFRKLDGLDGIFVAENGGLRCSAIRLRNGDLCLFSPVKGLDETAKASLAALGQVALLLAPNHYHNKGLAEYAQAFPDARLCAPAAAAPRLEKQTELKFDTLDELKAMLPDGMRVIETQGLKTGEIWLGASIDQHHAWLVVDAFCGPKGNMTSVSGTPAMLGTFPNFGVADKRAYKDWVTQQISADNPTVVIPCHGAIIEGVDLANKLQALIDENIS